MTRLVSVVIPAYQNAGTIDATLRSVLAQDYPDLEVIVADHASTDGTWDRLLSYTRDPRVTVLRTEAGGGALRNWNRVSQAATGEYVKLVCGDDLISPDLVSTQMAALAAEPGAVLSAVQRDIVDAHEVPLLRGIGLAGLSGRVSGRAAVRRAVRTGTNLFGEPACVLMRRDALESIGWWDSTFPYLIDQATYSRVLLTGDLVAIPRSLAAFRVSDAQWSVRLATEQSAQARGFHAWLRADHPDVVSRADVAIGDLRARLRSRLRRLVYLVHRSRLRSPS